MSEVKEAKETKKVKKPEVKEAKKPKVNPEFEMGSKVAFMDKKKEEVIVGTVVDYNIRYSKSRILSSTDGKFYTVDNEVLNREVSEAVDKAIALEQNKIAQIELKIARLAAMK